jgi:RHS repeat-associated protein
LLRRLHGEGQSIPVQQQVHGRRVGPDLYGHRYFSPELGRFINRDPSEEQGGANLYSFCGNNGVSAWDRLGLRWP